MLYSDISPRTQAYADRRLLTRAVINNVLGQFGQVRTLPQKSTQIVNFRRYNKLDSTPVQLQEGVTPTGKSLTKADVPATIHQYGDWIEITDVILDTHEDPILKESIDILGEQSAEMYDKIRAGILKAGTNVLYSNGAVRTAVNTMVSKDLLRKATRTLKAQEAKQLREIMNAGPNISTNPIAAAFVGVCHSDLQADLEQLADWVPVHKYANPGAAIRGEIGASGDYRFVVDNNLTTWVDGGGAKNNGTYDCLSTSGVKADVYPLLVFGKDAYGIVEMAGKNAISTYVNNPKASIADPLAQRGSVGWKGWTTCVILQDLWMLRLEVAAKSY